MEKTSRQEAIQLYERWLYELWTSGDQALAEQLVTPGFVGHWPGQDVHGPAGLVAAVGQSLALFADVTTSIEVGPVIDGDLVAARWRFTGAYRGGIPGVTAAAGTPATLRGADMLRTEAGRVVEYWVSSDVDQLMADLGTGD